jgi:hypothetical protein
MGRQDLNKDLKVREFNMKIYEGIAFYMENIISTRPKCKEFFQGPRRLNGLWQDQKGRQQR